jgi:hypothetical protein
VEDFAFTAGTAAGTRLFKRQFGLGNDIAQERALGSFDVR